MLKEGDIIEIVKGHRFYTKLPEHFVYADRIGCFTRLSQTEVVAGETKNGLDTNFYCGRYVVTKTATDGGGTGHGANDVYPNGHHVWCKKLKEKGLVFVYSTATVNIEFYQSGHFTAMIKDIEPVGKAKVRY